MGLILFFFIVFILVIVGIYIFYSRETLLDEAINLYKEGKDENALELFKSYSTMRPSNIVARQYLIEIYFKRSKRDKYFRKFSKNNLGKSHDQIWQ